MKKESNPKDNVGVKKVPLHVVSSPVMMELGPPKVINQNWIKEYNKKAEDIMNKYPNPAKAFTEK